jgi:hypothetical protein
MTYESYLKLKEDIKYSQRFSDDNLHVYHRSRYDDDSAWATIISQGMLNQIRKEWMDHVKQEYELTKKSNTALGKFLKKYPLDFKEMCCLLELINSDSSRFVLFRDEENDEDENPFVKYKIRYESSQLRRFKLVYKIVDPLRPLKTVFEVSYKAQLAIKNKKYTSEYEQLDLALEEEAKRSSPDALDSLYYVIDPKINFDDLIVTEQLKEDLKSAIARDSQKDKIFKKWGFKKVVEYGK